MKKSRIAKFALLGASAAALAATLSTSTYAWYVSNKTANVTPVLGSTASGTSDNTIAVSTTGAKKDFHKTISLPDKTSGLVPVVRKNATLGVTGTLSATYYTLNETTDIDTNTNGKQIDASTTTTAGYYEYVFYMLASVDCTVAPVLTVKNTTEDFTTLKQINYSPAEANKITGVSAGDSFTVNALEACRISLAVETGKFVTQDSAEVYAKNDNTTAPTEYTSLLSAAATLATPTGTAYGTTHATAGAHNYYEFMTGNILSGISKDAYTGTALTTITLTAGVPVRLYYSLWLDGASDLCFNACQGQTLSVAFDYTATPTN